ncbi:MAG: NADP-dependent oxidoreductase [Rhodospirillaceae bacterium]|jgi:NADPH:quinone reductase-like Zn-dependent oxidoreductase|nr:NADP-dependent oxidoreductase [Rhodospirillaceae bacterium]MBT4045226.1 NADP-dependent oxidoreductase [Rhodospirillaceae bacterium]MBT4688170.1 NADP-dependent oxidoreductase [Rhodospirillaceae bacterium]MBT5081896.1 NADP-dependent oxidoreductase [Rhodospirillaceae bacterium]MBT5523119.1 NADP-dependent oxidoreductase [Rhodospirillaceae bacterium]
MKAALIEKNGGPEVLIYGDAPDPVAGPGEVVVDIHAASVNAADWKVRVDGDGKALPFPYILGRDFSGLVSALGDGVTDFAIGDAVFGVCDVGQEGAYAEKIAMKAAIIARKPDALSHMEAVSLALTGLTATVSIEDTLKLQAGETILIQGGAGGVAGFAIQLAKHLGAHVITTASAANHDYMRQLGADEIIDYNTQDFTKTVSNCDAVFETVGGDVSMQSYAVLKAGGRAAFIASGGTAPVPPRDDVQGLRPAVGRDREHLERVAELVALGAVQIPPITEYPLSEAAAAHRVSEARHLRGKLIFKVR